MRPLTDEETRVFFEKLNEYIGRSIKALLDRADEPHCFRLHKDRVFYASERVMRQAGSVARDELVSMGVCFGRFTKSRTNRPTKHTTNFSTSSSSKVTSKSCTPNC